MPEYDYDEQESRIAKIFSSNEIPDVSKQHAETFINFIKTNISPNVLLVGREIFFPWEESYMFGRGTEREYKYLKKKQISHDDQVQLISFEKFDYDGDWVVKVKRLSDKKSFNAHLSWFKCVETDSNNAQLLDDFAFWIVNWC